MPRPRAMPNSTRARVLDEGDPVQLGREHHELLSKLEQLNVFGGCCGTDHRHVEEICKACITR